MTTQQTTENKKNKWLYAGIGLLAFLLVVQTGAFVYYLTARDKNEAARKNPAAHEPAYRQPAARRADPFSSYTRDPFFQNPFRSMMRMEDQMNRLFSGLSADNAIGGFVPSIDIEEKPDQYIVRSDLPGLQKDKIDVTIQGNLLTIQGVRKEIAESGDDGSGFYAQERSYGSFARTVTLPGPVKEEKIWASYKEGVLTITLPKAENSGETGKINIQ